ncbi:MAG: hypothetical protein DMF72_14260 [Acidobacteria bacterium]|nr:MAG: hypothetical protein DMF72_14260 [Acidobacteriota bacterium]
MSSENENVLEDSRVYIEALLTVQRSGLRKYRQQRLLLLVIGLVLILVSPIWWLIFKKLYGETSGITLIQVYAPIGVGLVTTTAMAYPAKEITRREGKIITYEKLLGIIQRAKNEQKNRSRIKGIREQIQNIIAEMHKEC